VPDTFFWLRKLAFFVGFLCQIAIAWEIFS